MVDGTVIPWEITVKLTELVENHIEFTGDESLYTTRIVAVMNKDYSMSGDLRAILHKKSGQALSKFAAEAVLEYNAPGCAIAVDKGNTIVQIDSAKVASRKEKAQPVIERWVADMDSKGIDGNALIEQAKERIKKYGG